MKANVTKLALAVVMAASVFIGVAFASPKPAAACMAGCGPIIGVFSFTDSTTTTTTTSGTTLLVKGAR